MINTKDFIETLMNNNELVREQALRLNDKVKKLHLRERELVRRVELLFEQKAEKSKEEAEFADWLVLFKTGTDPVDQEEEKVNEKSQMYDPDKEAEGFTDEKVVRFKDELKMISRLKRNTVFPWIEGREIPSEADIGEWEAAKGVKLPKQFKSFLQIVGGNSFLVKGKQEQCHIHGYSPLLALLPINYMGWTEIWGQDDDAGDEFLDDPEVRHLLDICNVGHDYDDSFVCEQVCGEPPTERVRVLLVGAPLNVKNESGKVINSRMFLNIRPAANGTFVGDGLLYRFDCIDTEEGDSDLVLVGSPFDWLESSILTEVEDRRKKAGETDPIVKRYQELLNKKKAKIEPNAVD